MSGVFGLDPLWLGLSLCLEFPISPNILTGAYRLTADAGTNLPSPGGLLPDHTFVYGRRIFYCGRLFVFKIGEYWPGGL